MCDSSNNNNNKEIISRILKEESAKSGISFRISVRQWMPEGRFFELLDLFERYRRIVDEITYFISETHAPLPIPVVRERAALLSERIHETKRRGFKTGINVLCTIGHHEENLSSSFPLDYPRMTDIDGRTCRGAFCPNNEAVRGYIRQLYEIVASIDSDYIWIDDDVRLRGHMPIKETCFCDACLQIFEEEQGIKHTRESLKRAFNEGSMEEKLEQRLKWLKHNRNTISRLLECIEKTVHAVKPGLATGFMSGERPFEGYDFDAWANVLSRNGKTKAMWRPGGGFYNDDRPKELVEKAHQIGRQVSLLPSHVRNIQAEVENFPYQRLKKSLHATAVEAASYMAAGCTGVAFNILSMHDEPLTEYLPLMDRLAKTRSFYDLIVERNGRFKPLGIYAAWGKNSFAVRNIWEGNWFDTEKNRVPGSGGEEIFELGLPVAYSAAFAHVILASGDEVLAMSREEILKMLSSGLYMDARALENLNNIGYKDLTGFEVAGYVDADCMEELTGHFLNGSYKWRRRDGRQSFWKNPAAILKPAGNGTGILARMVNYDDKEVARCCMGIYENRLGGRICVAAYCPWTFLQNLSKSSQIKSVMRWLSRDNIAAYVASFHKTNIWARQPEEGGMRVVLLNSSLDPAMNIVLMIKTCKETIYVHDMQGGVARVRAEGMDGQYRKFILPPIDGWDMRLIETA